VSQRYPWENSSQQWDESSFGSLNQGRELYQAREIMQEAIAAIQSGRIRYWFPTPGEPVDQEYVDEAVRTMDAEWERELGRDRARTGGPEFMKHLDPAQRACLVQRLAHVLRRRPAETS